MASNGEALAQLLQMPYSRRMPAIPAWPPKSLPRLFVEAPLAKDAVVELAAAQTNYLANVLRLDTGSMLRVFDNLSGEWLATIDVPGKKRMVLRIKERLREAEKVPDVWLAFSPVKRTQTDWLVEKATELGAARLLPIITARTVAERVKLERLRAISIEAAEQCGRTRLPEIDQPLPLRQLLGTRDHQRRLYFADEEGGEAASSAFVPGAALVLIGPEGGFTSDERSLVRAQPNSYPVSLGPRILRAETAALAALATYMAVAGDWRTY
jgi:16S rRNA (uracil1498-N3)-methyltransferase